MDDKKKTKKQLIDELVFLRQRIHELEQSESELKLAVETLRQSEEKFRALIDNAKDAIVLHDLEGRILELNREAHERLGYSREEILRMSPPEVDTSDLVPPFSELVETLRQKGYYLFESVHQRRDGTKIPVEVSIRSFELAGKQLAVGVSRDITERKRQEEALRQSEAVLGSVFKAVPVGLCIMKNRVFQNANKSYFENLGYSESDIIGQTPRFLFENDEEYDRVGKELYTNLVERGLASVQTIHKKRNGDKCKVILTAVPLKSADIYLGMDIVVFEDITDRKRAEEDLRKSERKIRALFDQTFHFIGLLTLDGTLIEANRTAMQFAGIHESDCIDKPFWDTPWWTHSTKLQSKLRDALTEAVKGKIVRLEVTHPAFDGIIHDVDFSLKPVKDELGNIIFLIAEGLDITERKQMEEALREKEERYRAFFSTSRDCIFITSPDGHWLDLNDAAVRLFGYDSREDLMKVKSKDLYVNPDDRTRHLQLIAEQGYSEEYPVSLRRKDGTVIDALITSVVIKNGAGRVIGFQGTIRDITERKRAEEEKRRLEERLQRSEKMEALGTLAGGVAHDLNNVLGVVVGYSELLLNEIDESSSIRTRLENIMKGGERATAIVQDLLTLARRGVPSRQVLNLNKIISDCQQSPEFKKLSSDHHFLKIRTDLEADLLNISGSSVHLGKTLYNLISNASEAMPNGGIVTIKTANQYLDKPIQGYDVVREGDYVVLSVSDTGEGIQPSDLKRIFEPFYTKKIMGRSGTGLGLAVVWGTVKDHHGYINVQSEEGKGSTFTLYFPVTRKDISADRIAVAISEYMGKGESILIVDDVKEQRDLAAEMLRKLSYTITSLSSGEEAVAYLKEHQADLMVLDMIMDPGIDGLDTYRRVIEIYPRQKAIIVSGFSETDRVTAAQKLGAGAYVRKPYILEKIGLAVRRELDR